MTIFAFNIFIVKISWQIFFSLSLVAKQYQTDLLGDESIFDTKECSFLAGETTSLIGAPTIKHRVTSRSYLQVLLPIRYRRPTNHAGSRHAKHLAY